MKYIHTHLQEIKDKREKKQHEKKRKKDQDASHDEYATSEKIEHISESSLSFKYRPIRVRSSNIIKGVQTRYFKQKKENHIESSFKLLDTSGATGA